MRPNPKKGTTGVFANSWIPQGELLVVWGGNIVPGVLLAALPEEIVRYSLQVEEDLYLVTVTGPEAADYINHSCDPNAGMSSSISLVALRLIAPGEEICYDYAMSDSTPYDEFTCACGTLRCRNRVTGNDWQRPELQARYAGFFSPYLQQRIEQVQAAVSTNGHGRLSRSTAQYLVNADHANERRP
jgi:hypothetical protein